MTPLISAALEPVTERTLEFLGGGAAWVQILVWLVGALVVGLTVYNHRRLLPMARRVLMIGLRSTLVLMLIGVFYQPSCLEEKVAVNRNTVAVVVDSSQSMVLPHQDTTRVALARSFITAQESLWRDLAEDHDLAFFRFGRDLAPLPNPLDDADAAAAAIVADAGETAILGGLSSLRERFRNQDLGAVLLVTDGIDTSPDGRRATLSLAGQHLVRDLDAPITSFTTAGDPGIKDVSVAHLAYNNFAFLLNATSLEATIRVHGYVTGQLRVRLIENGVEVATEDVTITPMQRDYPVTFDFVPKKLGKQVFGVEVASLPDEIYAKNNLQQVIINVIRDKIRVVQIVGQPSWDERYLRNHLKENPNVDLVSFFILVNRFNLRPLRSDETSLIPFPARELFEEELGGFDLLVFQNFNYGPFSTRRYLPAIAEYVRKGGAFVMVGGPLSLSAGGYYGTPIMDVLPITIPPGFGGAESTSDTQPFTPRLTESGAYHPITRLALDPTQNRGIWQDITPLEGINLATRAHEDAVVLLDHPTLKTPDGAPQPVAAVREVGEGRSMVVSTDSTWHWAFKAGRDGKDTFRYDTFWSQAIRWLIKDPELDLVRVRVLSEKVPVGETAEAEIQVFRPDYRPAARQTVSVVVRRRGPGDAVGEGRLVSRDDDAVTNADGELIVSVPVEQAGIYEVEAKARVVSGRTAAGSDLFVGTETNAEFARVVGDDRLLTNLAKASGGAVFPLTTERPDSLAVTSPREVRVRSRHYKELWSSGWTVLLIAALFSLEWWLRRRYGYL